jgi:hypothetical protein
VEEETDETVYWMELLVEAGITKAELLEGLMKEVMKLWRSPLLPLLLPGNASNGDYRV